ncbi:unnamed protein product [Moneuplotes crassus]|uniref:Uncharacterized protein n=2 Tax=Euplotes crassus TaxID=5936 RepID=A0AAD1UIW2_EUPCR|nr:unnamed protein product [Moneuplotes crassus]
MDDKSSIKIISKYLIDKAGFIYGKKKQILSICTDRVIIQNTNADLHYSVQLNKHQSIHYESFKEIRASDKNETDFSIIAEKKYDFSCDYRNILICELKHEVSMYLESCDCDLFYCKLIYDMYPNIENENNLNPAKVRQNLAHPASQSASIQVYESILKVRVPLAENINEMKKTSGNIEEILGLKYVFTKGIIKRFRDKIFPRHDLTSTNRSRRKTSNKALKKRSLPIFQKKKEDVLLEDNWRLKALDTPNAEFYLNSMDSEVTEEQLIDTKDLDIIIPSDIAEESSCNFSKENETRLKSNHTYGTTVINNQFNYICENGQEYVQKYSRYEGKYAVNCIYLTEIRKIVVNHNVLIILKENYEVIKFIKDDKKISDLVSLANICASNALEILNKEIEVHNVETLTEQINHVINHFNENSVFSSLVYSDEAYYFDSFNNIRKVHIRIDRDSLHILKNSCTGIIISAYLKDLNYCYIYDVLPIVRNHAELCNIRLIFKCATKKIEIRLNYRKREELLSVIITLRRITKNYLNEMRFILNDTQYLEKYYILMPCNSSIDDYDAYMVKEFENVAEVDNIFDPRLFEILDEAIMNCKFTNTSKVSSKLLDILSGLLPYIFTQMVNKFQEDQERCQVILELEDTQQKREVCTKAKNMSNVDGYLYFKILYSKMLNFCRLLANSKAYFREFCNQENLILVIMNSLNFEDTYISCQAAQFLSSLVMRTGPGNAKLERANKQRILNPKLDLVGHLKEFFKSCDKTASLHPEKLKLLEINGAFLILMLLIKDTSSTGSSYDSHEYDKYIADAIMGDDKSLFHSLDRLALKGNFSVSFGATMLINRALAYYQQSNNEEDRKKEEHCKDYILNYSVQFIWNIYLLMSCKFEEQNKESLSLLSNILYKNKQAVKLIMKMFDKSMFYKVEGADELFQRYSWTEREWKAFFENLGNNYNTATEQWNKHTRKELMDKILLEIDGYLSTQRDLKEAAKLNKMVHPSLDYDKDKNIIITTDHFRWNNDEFEITYKKSLRSYYKVGKYYLSVLLNEKPVVPYLIEVITSPIVFWSQLNERFICCENLDEKIIIIKVLINLYQKHYQMIKELNTMTFWVKQLTKASAFQLHFWILQLIYVSLSIPLNEYSRANYKSFKKANGMTAIFGVLNSTFKEFEIEPELNSSEEGSEIYDVKMANYTGKLENLTFFERNSIHISKGILVVNIVNYLMEMIKFDNYVPLPAFINYIFKKRSINVLIMLLFIENVDLSKTVLNLFIEHFHTPFALKNLYDNGIIEGLVLNLPTKNSRRALTLLSRISAAFPNYNEELDYQTQTSEEEKSTLDLCDLEIQEKVKNSVLFRFIHSTLVDMYESQDTKTFSNLFKHEKIENEYIIWNEDCRLHLLNTLQAHFKPNLDELLAFLQKGFGFYKIPGNLPMYLNRFREKVCYKSLDNELKIKKFYARMWVRNASSIPMTKDKLHEFYEEVMVLIKKYTDYEFLSEKKENLKQGMKNIVICLQVIMKTNDAFDFRQVLEVKFIDTIIEIESKNPHNPYVWVVIGTFFEMIRKSLKWKDLYTVQASYLVCKLEDITCLIKERIKAYGFYLPLAETLSEVVNTAKLVISNYPDCIVETIECCNLISSISTVYSELDMLYQNLFMMKFENSESPIISKDIRSSNTARFTDGSQVQRISQYVSQFRESPSLPKIKIGTRKYSRSESMNYCPRKKKLGSKSKSSHDLIKGRSTITNIVFSKNPAINYNSRPLMDIVVKQEDPFAGYIILHSFKFLGVLIQEICTQTKLHKQFVTSGLLWKIFLTLLNDFSMSSLKAIIDPTKVETIFTKSLRLFFSHCNYLKEQPSSAEESKDHDTDELEDEKALIQYYEACLSLIGPYMMAELTSEVQFIHMGIIGIDDKDDGSLKFLELYHSINISTPYLIWNDNHKCILKDILEKEVKKTQSKKDYWVDNPYKDFSYLAQDQGLVVDGIYIKQLNKDLEFTVKDPSRFIEKSISKLYEVQNDDQLCFDILLAIRNIISSQMVQTLKQKVKNKFIELVPILISKRPEETLKKSKELKIASILMEILSHILRKFDSVDDFTQPEGICQILYGILCDQTDQKMTESVRMCLQAITNNHLFSVEEHLWKTGILGLFLKSIFHTNNFRYKVMIASFFLQNMNDEIIQYGRKLMDALLPLDFHDARRKEEVKDDGDLSPRRNTNRNSSYINFHGMEFDEKSSSKVKKAEDIIEEEVARLDQEYTESLRVVWDSTNTKTIKELIMPIKFENSLQDPSILENAIKKPFKNPLLKGELICDDIILRVYNKKAPQILDCDNILFLKNLFSLLKVRYNKSVRLAYIIDNNGMPENRPEPRESQKADGGYITYDPTSVDLLQEYYSGTMESWQRDQSQICHEITIILSSILININMNLSQRNNYEEITRSLYTEEELILILEGEIDGKIDNCFKNLHCTSMRCTLLQIFMMVPQVSQIQALVQHLKRCSNYQDRKSEIQLTFSTILRTILEDESKIDDFSEDDIDFLTKIGLSSSTNIKILEIILYKIRRDSSFSSKLSIFRDSIPEIDWKLVDETPELDKEIGNCSDNEICNRIQTLQNVWSVKESLSSAPHLDSFITSASEDADLEAGDGVATNLFSMKFPSVSRKSQEKFNFEEAISFE